MNLPQTPTPLPELPVGHRHVFNKKFLELFALIALVSVGAYAGVQYWQSQQLVEGEYLPAFTPRADVRVGWKTYTSTEDLKFTIQYPPTWTVKTFDAGYGIKAVSIDSTNQRIGSVEISSHIRLGGVPCNGGVNEQVQLQDRVISVCHFPGSSQEPEVYYYESSTPNGISYSISASPYSAKENRDQILEILSTFRLTDAGQFCGGIAAIKCASGYTCKLEGSYPDAGGACVAQ